MSQISLFVTMKAKDGKGPELIETLEAVFSTVDKEEGTIHYGMHQATNDPDTIMFFEMYKDNDAFQAHATNPETMPVLASIGNILDGSPSMVITTPVHVLR